ncbi:MAG: cardiolipin synthase [Pseudoflavonifractor sp.]|nr:cardiolipin synthase [Pseudoflavonifractor sp.]
METIGQYLSLTWIYWVLAIGYLVTVLCIIGIIVSENRNPVKSLAWVTVLLLLPVAGPVFYIFFGRNLKNKRMVSRKNKRRLRKREPLLKVDFASLPLSRESLQQIRLAHKLTGAIYYPGNKVGIFTSGREKFDSLLRDIAAARDYIHMQYYIFDDDEIGHAVRDALIARARAGVTVRVIYDHIGSIHVKRRFFDEMRRAGISVYPFFRVTFPQFATRINWRNHRKICVIDGEIGYIGGMNIADRYIKGLPQGIWRDTHIRITGPAVASLQYSFAYDWNFMGQPVLEEHVPTPTDISDDAAGMQMMTSGPMNQWSNIAFLLFKAIANAKRLVYIQTPYFLPTDSLLKALQAAALSNVDVRIMIPSRSDSAILRYASFSYISECLRAGIRIYLYEAGMLHSKTIVVDDEFCSVGSTNFDFRSFEHNFECNMFIYSSEVNAHMREIFLDDLRECTRVNATTWRRRSLGQKIKESIVRLMSPVL